MDDRVYREAYYKCLRDGKPLSIYNAAELTGYYICTLAEKQIAGVRQDVKHCVVSKCVGEATVKLLEALGYREVI